MNDAEPGSWARWCRALRERDRLRTAEYLIEILDFEPDPCDGDGHNGEACYECHIYGEWALAHEEARGFFNAVRWGPPPSWVQDLNQYEYVELDVEDP